MMSPRTLACLVALDLLVSAGGARAEGPPPPPPSYPPPGVLAPGWAPSQDAPYTPMKRRSSAMIGAGIVLISLSTVGVIAGTAMFVGGDRTTSVLDCQPLAVGQVACATLTSGGDPGLKMGGIAPIVLGTIALGAGIPLLVVGSQKVPDKDEAPSPAPTVRVGAGALSASWWF